MAHKDIYYSDKYTDDKYEYRYIRYFGYMPLTDYACYTVKQNYAGQGKMRGARCEEGKVRGSVRGGTRLVGYK